MLTIMNNLQSTGDNIWRVEGMLSSVWNAVLSEYVPQRTRFSDLVQRAREQEGLSMSDIREDLCGLDLARTCSIMMRCMGWTEQGCGTALKQSLFGDNNCFVDIIPKELLFDSTLSVEQFMLKLRDCDADIDKALQKRSGGHGRQLRCVVDLDSESEQCHVNITCVEDGDMFAAVKEANVAMKLVTDVYDTDNPLFVSGKGVGADVTVGGLLMDMSRIAAVMDTASV